MPSEHESETKEAISSTGLVDRMLEAVSVVV